MMFTKPIHQPFPIPFHGNRLGNQVANAISNAFRDKRFDRRYAKVFGAWYFAKNAAVDGTVYDETPSRDSTRPELTNRVTSFDGSNQSAYIAAGDFKLIENDGDAFTAHFVFKCDTPAGNGNFWSCFQGGVAGVRLYPLTTTQVRVQFVDELDVTDHLSITSGTHDFMDGTWQHVTVVYAGGTDGIVVYVNGRQIASKTTNDGVKASTSQNLAFAVTQVLNSDWAAIEASFFGAWKGVAFSPAEVRDLYLNLDSGTHEPDVAVLFAGEDIYDISANRNTVSQANNPTRFEDESNPISPHDFNHAGYGFERLETNGEFDSDISGWSAAAVGSVEWDSGKIKVSYSGSAANVGIATTISGKPTTNLRVTGDIVVLSGSPRSPNTFSVRNAYDTPTATGLSDSGSFDVEITTGGGTAIWIYCYAEDIVFTVDNIRIIDESRLVPAQWGSTTTDANGNPLAFRGEVARNGRLESAPCIEFNGSNQSGSLKTSSLLGSDSFTLIFGIKPGIKPANSQRIFGNTHDANSGGMLITYLNNQMRIIVVGANETKTADDVVVTGQEQMFVVRVDRSANETAFFIDGIRHPLAVSDIDWDSIGTLDWSESYAIGAQKEGASNANFDGLMWDFRYYDTALSDAEILAIANTGTSETTPTRHYPISEEGGETAQCVITRKLIEFENSPSWGAQNLFFYGESIGNNAVPVFVDGVELIGPNVNYDGIKSAVIEIDFASPTSELQVLYANGFIAPFALYATDSKIRVQARNSSEGTSAHEFFAISGQDVYQLKVVILEDDANPATQSTITIYERTTGEILETKTGLDINLSSASANGGDQQIGSYPLAIGSFTGDIYRLRHLPGGVEKCLVKFPSFTNETVGESDFVATGGSFDIKRIPAANLTLDANGYPLQNTKASHQGTQATLKLYLADRNSEQAIYHSGEANDSTFNDIDDVILTGPFDIFYEVKSSNFDQLGMIVGHQNSGQSQKLGFNGTLSGSSFFRILDDDDQDDTTVPLPTNDKWHSFKVSRDADGIIAVSLDGTVYTLYGGAPKAGTTSFNQLLSASSNQQYSGSVKNIKIVDNGAVVLDKPFYKDFLDRSPNANHGVLTVNGLAFNSNTAPDALHTPIEETETLCVGSTGNNELVLVGAK